MKIEILQEKAKNKQLEEEIFQMQQAISAHHKETTELQQQITELQVAQRKVPKLQDELNQMRAKLEISNKKYEELRKIKHQLEDKVEQFEAKLNEIQKKQSEDQVKNITFQQTVKSQNSSKIKQIEEMSLAIKMNYEKKIQVMEKHQNQLKDKCKYYKQQNAKLYEAFDAHSKKEAKLKDKYQKAHSQQQQLEAQFSTVKESLAINQQKLKTQTLLSKELKRELINAQKGKMDLEKKLKKLQHSKLPNLVSQIKLLSDEINAFKSAIQTYKEITKKEKIADDA